MDDDIDAVIKIAQNFKYHEPHGTSPFNRISILPETKRRMKQAIKERMRLLAGAYISLASFIDDDLVDFLEASPETKDKEKLKKISRIYKNAIHEMNHFRKEIRAFKLLANDEN